MAICFFVFFLVRAKKNEKKSVKKFASEKKVLHLQKVRGLI